MPRPAGTAALLAEAVAFAYLIAFVSLGAQLRGLYGPGGLEPYELTLGRRLGRGWEARPLADTLWEAPSLLLLAPRLGLPLDVAGEALCLVGTALAAHTVAAAAGLWTFTRGAHPVAYLASTRSTARSLWRAAPS
jgi:hypothetical protein